MRNQVSSRKKPMNIVRIIKTPIRAISKALDLYVKSVSKFANTSNRPIMTTEDTPNSQRLPRSLSTSRILLHNDPPTESALVRSISSAPTSCRSSPMRSPEIQVYMRQQYGSRKGVPRSCSVGMGKIDEDRALSFRMDNIVVTSKLGIKNDDSVFSKSPSYNRVSSNIIQGAQLM